MKHCCSGTNGVLSQRIRKAVPQPAAGKVASGAEWAHRGSCCGRQFFGLWQRLEGPPHKLQKIVALAPGTAAAAAVCKSLS